MSLNYYISLSMYEYEEVALSELVYDADGQRLQYPCPCGDLFELSIADFMNGKDIAQCPTCSLTVKVLYSADDRAAFLVQHQISIPASAPVAITA